MKINTRISWSLKEVKELVADENSRVYFVQSKKHISLHPYHLTDIKKALHEILGASINFYDNELKGYILCYKNPELLDTLGLTLYDSHFVHVNIQADFYVFKPEIGCTLSGIVNKKAQNHIGVLVHKVFNVSIPRDEDDDSWQGNFLHVGQNVKFTVTCIDVQRKLPYIKGELLPSQVQKISKNLKKPVPNQRKTFNSDNEEDGSSSEEEKNTKIVTSTPKPANNHSIFVENSDSSSDDDPYPTETNENTRKSKKLINGNSSKKKSPPPKSVKSEESEDSEDSNKSIRCKIEKQDSSESESEAWPKELINSPTKSRLLEAGVLTQVESTKKEKTKKQMIFSYETSDDSDSENERKTKIKASKDEKRRSSPKKSPKKKLAFSAASSSNEEEKNEKLKEKNKKSMNSQNSNRTPLQKTPKARKINPGSSDDSSDDNHVIDQKLNRKKSSTKKKNVKVHFDNNLNGKNSKKSSSSAEKINSPSSSDEDSESKKFVRPKGTPYPKKKLNFEDSQNEKEFLSSKTTPIARQIRASSSDDSSDDENLNLSRIKSEKISQASNVNSKGISDDEHEIPEKLKRKKETGVRKKIFNASDSSDDESSSPKKSPKTPIKEKSDSKEDSRVVKSKIKFTTVTMPINMRIKVEKPSSDDSSDENEDNGSSNLSVGHELPLKKIKQEPDTREHIFTVPEVPAKKSPKKIKNKKIQEPADESSKKRKNKQLDIFENVQVKEPPLSDVEKSPKSKEKSKKRRFSLKTELDSTDSSDVEPSKKKRKSKLTNNHVESSSIDNNNQKMSEEMENSEENGNVSVTFLNNSIDESINGSSSSKKSKKKKEASNFFASIRIKQEPVSDDEINLKSRKKTAEDANSSVKLEQPLTIKSEKKRKLDNSVKTEANASDVEGPSAKKKIRTIFSE